VRTAGGMLVFVDAEPEPCSVCGGAMHVQKTRRRHGITLEHGRFIAHETVYVCAARCRRDDGTLATRRASALAERLPPKGTVGYDLIVFVGLARFVEHRQREEIRAALAERGIVLSTGEISHLGRRFLAYLAALHEARSDALRAALEKDGGWPLHVDATGEDGRGTLLVVYTGWRRWVLGSWRVPTERSDALLPRLRDVVGRFGAPCAIMRDLGRAVTEACDKLVAELKRNIPVLACHFHFLRDVGRDLLRASHDELRALLRRFKVKAKLRALTRAIGRALGTDIADARRSLNDWQSHREEGHVLPEGQTGLAAVRAMAQWVLDYRADGEDLGFPFDVPNLDLYERCLTVCRASDAFLRRPPSDRRVQRALKRLRGIVHPVESEVPFEKTARRLRNRRALFSELRAALRLRPKAESGSKEATAAPVLTIEQAAAELRDIEAAVLGLSVSLQERRPQRGPAHDQREAIDVVITHLQRHGDRLFGHAISIPENAGGGVRLVDRTNNSLEGFFREMKHGERRRSGRKILAQDFEQLPPTAALAQNLRCGDYVTILCGSLDELSSAFARLDASSSRRSSVVPDLAPTDDDVVSASLPTADREIVRTEEMDLRIRAAAKSRAPHPSVISRISP
jgi:hypothetical protein